MVGEVENIGHLIVARRAGGEPVELVRSPEEVVFLGFDSHIKRLVELHVLRSGTTLNSVAKGAAFARAQQASKIRGAAFMRILDVGEDQGLVYYTTNLNDGEFVTDYMDRRGALPPATAFPLVFQLLEELIHLKEHRCLVAHMRLDRVVVSTLEDTFLQLRIYDYGLSSSNLEEEDGDRRMVVQACELIFLMLTGKPSNGDNPDRYPCLTALPMDLRTTIRTSLTDPTNAPTSIEKVREDVREAYGALVSGIQARNSRKQLVVTPALQPRSQLQDLLLENVPVETILGNRFHAEDADHVRRYPFSIPCINAKNDQAVTVHLLPPSRIVDKTQYEAVPLQMWRFNAERHPNILRSLSLWESPDWTFLTEEREPGFTLSRLMAERAFLNPAEVLVVLKQVRAGIEQALECGVQRVDLHPSNILLRVGRAGPLLNREYERLMQKRLDAWPNFLVKLRAHLTMRNLYEPLLVDKPEDGELEEAHLADRDYRHRAFIALAAYLLSGARQTTSAARFPESVSETLTGFVREMLELARKAGSAPGPNEFLEQYEAQMNGPAVPDLATRLRGATVAMEEMESAGSVSDFDNEWASGDNGDDLEAQGPVARTLSPSHFNHRRKEGARWPVLLAAAVVVFGMFGWWQVSGSTAQGPATATHSPKSKLSKAESLTAKKSETSPVAKPKPVTKPVVAERSVGGPLMPPTMVRKSDAPLPPAEKTPPVFASLQNAVKTEPPPASAWESVGPVTEAEFSGESISAKPVLAAALTPSDHEGIPTAAKSDIDPAVREEVIVKAAIPAVVAPPVKTEMVKVEVETRPTEEPQEKPEPEVPTVLAELPHDWKSPGMVAIELPVKKAPSLEAQMPPPLLAAPADPANALMVAAQTAPAAAGSTPQAESPPEIAVKKTSSMPAAVEAAVAPAPKPEPGTMMIRKAIMPTEEEIAKFKQAKANDQLRSLPAREALTDSR